MSTRIRRFLLLLILVTLSFNPWIARPTSAAADEATPALAPRRTDAERRYFPETGQYVVRDFKAYYEAHGDLAIFGLPLTKAFVWDGRLTQVFERAVFQNFPEQADQGNRVQLRLLGSAAAAGQAGGPWSPLGERPSDPAVQFFPQTGHSLGGAFQSFWLHNGGLGNFGYPLSEPFDEPTPGTPGDDGQTHLVQYFERARMEYHPENAGTAYEVELGQLGRAFLQTQDLPAGATAREAPPDSGAREPITPETPNGTTLRPTVDGDGVKRVMLTTEIVDQELLNTEGKRVVARTFGVNGGTPGPTLVFTEGDRVAITVVNRLPEATSIHWHGVILPNSQDGVPEAGEPSPSIPPGGSFTYQFTVQQAGTHMYHSHTDTPKQDLLGVTGALIFLPKQETGPRVDHDYVFWLHEWSLPQDLKPEQIKDLPRTGSPVDTVNSVTAMPNWATMEFNFFTMNGKAFPNTQPLDIELGERVRVRFFNIGMNTHPMHLHGQDFLQVEQDGNRIAPENQPQINTIPVAPGQTQAIEFDAINPGIWPFHCHLAHHVSNNLSSGFGGMATVVRIR